MPLKKGVSQKVHSGNVREMLHGWKKSGKIGNTKPGSMKKAMQIANAAAYSKARSSRSKKTRYSQVGGA